MHSPAQSVPRSGSFYPPSIIVVHFFFGDMANARINEGDPTQNKIRFCFVALSLDSRKEKKRKKWRGSSRAWATLE